ncbi:hypothetical protein PR048_023220 [Dryococelus australis]|uniref:Uncharacterized protein n=1 Tax=Dryococelus australis TaxID=614101 RepID=A0ABQ9GTI5_9NEOP|nr:hypothetical protein PR048_023220 [Dryococelus australis]
MTLTSKFPRDQSDGILWSFIQELVAPGSSGTESRTKTPMEISSIVSTSAPVERVNLLVPSIPVPASLKAGASGGIITSANISSVIAGGANVGSLITGTGNVGSIIAGGNIGSVIAGGGNMGSVITSGTASTIGSVITSGSANSIGGVIASGGASTIGSVITAGGSGSLSSIIASSGSSNAGVSNTITPTTSLMIGSDIASALFASGNFPTPSSLIGLSGESSRTMLGAPGIAMGGIFIPPVGFKLDNISVLKPISMSTANPIPSTSKSVPNIPSDLIPPGVKLAQVDSATFVAPESLDKNCTVTSGHVP